MTQETHESDFERRGKERKGNDEETEIFFDKDQKHTLQIRLERMYVDKMIQLEVIITTKECFNQDFV